MYNDEIDEGESSSNGYTGILDNVCLVISKLWNEREKHINTDSAVTSWMSCVIPHIREDVFKITNGKQHFQVNNFIKT